MQLGEDEIMTRGTQTVVWAEARGGFASPRAVRVRELCANFCREQKVRGSGVHGELRAAIFVSTSELTATQPDTTMPTRQRNANDPNRPKQFSTNNCNDYILR